MNISKDNLVDSSYKYILESGEKIPIYRIKELSISDCEGYIAFKPDGTKVVWYRNDEIGYAQFLAAALRY